MSLANATALTASVARWLRRADLAADVPDFIAMFEGRANLKLRSWRMLKRAPLTISGEFTTLPADFLEVKSLRNTTTGQPIRSASEEVMDDARQTYDYAAGDPMRYTLEQSGLRCSPVPGASVSVSLLYYAALPPLSANTANWLLTLYPQAYLNGALAESAPFLKADERLPVWVNLRDDALDGINARETGFGGALDVLPSTYGAGSFG